MLYGKHVNTESVQGMVPRGNFIGVLSEGFPNWEKNLHFCSSHIILNVKDTYAFNKDLKKVFLWKIVQILHYFILNKFDFLSH